MGKTVKSITNAVGLTTPKVPGVGGISLDATPFDISKDMVGAQNRISQAYNVAAQDFDTTRAGKSSVLQQMSNAAQGKGPSIAAEQLKQASERNLAQQLAAAQASRSGGSAAGARRLSQNMAQSGQTLAQQSMIERLKERDNFLNASNNQEQTHLDLIRQQLEVDTAAKRTMQDYEKARSGAAATQSSLQSANQNAAAGRTAGLLGGGMMALAMSDENEKKNVKPADKKVDSFLNALKERQYEYKDPSQPGTAEGKRVGILAQDLEKSDMGKTMVKEENGVKMVDTVQGFGAVLAAQARLNDRLNKLESKKKAGKK